MLTVPRRWMNRRRIGVFVGSIAFYGIHEFLAVTFGFVTNSGVSFGVDLPIWISFFIWVVVGFFVFNKNNSSLWLFWWGASGNMIDRLRFGVVRDYWQFDLWGVDNNINDWCLFIGIILFAYHKLWVEKKSR